MHHEHPRILWLLYFIRSAKPHFHLLKLPTKPLKKGVASWRLTLVRAAWQMWGLLETCQERPAPQEQQSGTTTSVGESVHRATPAHARYAAGLIS